MTVSPCIQSEVGDYLAEITHIAKNIAKKDVNSTPFRHHMRFCICTCIRFYNATYVLGFITQPTNVLFNQFMNTHHQRGCYLLCMNK